MAKDGQGRRFEDRFEDRRHRYEEYFLEPSPEDTRQNHRLKNLEDGINVLRDADVEIWKAIEELKGADRALEVALIGKDGNNGIRGTMMEHYETVQSRIDKLDSAVIDMDNAIRSLTSSVDKLTTMIATIGKLGGALVGASAIVGVVWAIWG